MTDGGLDGLEAWAAEARAREASAARSRERWLRQQAAEEARFDVVVADLAATGTPVVVTTTAGSRHHGAITVVGDDFFGLRSAPGRLVLVAIDAVAVVRPAPAGAGPAGGAARAGRLVEALADAAARRARVQLRTSDGHTLQGELRSVGADVAVIDLDGEPAGTGYARLASISEISLFDSG